MDVYSRLRRDESFQLIQLSPDLLKVMENGEQMVLKSQDRDSSVYLCSDSQTFHVRRRNHSNTVLVMKNDKENNRSIGFASMDSELELSRVSGSIDISNVPLYEQGDVSKLLASRSGDSIEELLQKSTISRAEFAKQWSELNGCEVDGRAVMLGFNVVTNVLKTVITSMIAEGIDLDAFEKEELAGKIEYDEDTRPEFVETVLTRFATPNSGKMSLDKDLAAKWFGIHMLKTSAATGPVQEEDFLINWKDFLPAFLEVSIDMSKLVGHYVRPFPSMVQYFNSASLPTEPQQRFKELFRIQGSWDLAEMKPFIDDINTKNAKLESFVMKYARRKKVGKRYVISSR